MQLLREGIGTVGDLNATTARSTNLTVHILFAQDLWFELAMCSSPCYFDCLHFTVDHSVIS